MSTEHDRNARETTVDELADELERGAALIDVRETAEYVEGHVPGARSMPMGQLPDRLADLKPSQRVFVICASGNRSTAMRDFLAHAGFEAVNVSGGTSAWTRSGRALRDGMTA